MAASLLFAASEIRSRISEPYFDYIACAAAPNPEKPGWLKYNPDEFPSVLEADKQKIFTEMKKIVIEREGEGWRKKAKRMMKEAEKRRQKQREEPEHRIKELEENDPKLVELSH